jgi:hypothetical protein
MTDMHIKMPDVTPVVRYTANGIQTTFAFSFPIFASEDIVVLKNGATLNSGFTITGAGETSGGSVLFDTAPASGDVITILRQVPYERYTDFLEGGDFSARALNNELDYLTASIQQLSRDQESLIGYPNSENPALSSLPERHIRAGKALGFDGQGNPIAVDYGLTQAPTTFTATGVGATTRQVTDKIADIISVKDFGAVGDGVTDDTSAIRQALSAHHCVYIPGGTYRVTDTISVGFGQKIIGAGQSSIVKADTNLFTVFDVRSGYSCLSDFVIDGGDIGLFLSGTDAPCVQNRVMNLVIRNTDSGIILDGGNDTQKPCYWNIFDHCLVLSPLENGILLDKSGTGDTPNANIFNACRVYSNGVNISDHGIHVRHGSFYNRFINCEVNVTGTAQSCFTVGAGGNETVIDNFYAESSNGVPNIQLENGSQKTLIQNLLATSDGAAIDDQSGGSFQAINAGYPTPNKFDVMQVNDLTITQLRQDTVFIEDAGSATYPLNNERSVHLVSAYNGAITIHLPAASTLPAAKYLIKKIDQTGNGVIITDPNGLGIDRKSQIILGGPYDYIEVISNGAEWLVTSSNRMAGNTQFHETTGTIDIDMAVDTYLISSYGGAVTTRLPPANAVEAIGRTITIKKTDPSTNPVSVSEQGGNGPDNYTQTLSSQYNAITVVSNGAAWHITSRF